MKRFWIIYATAILTASFSWSIDIGADPCDWNHAAYPFGGHSIGCVAGWEACSEFFGAGGYGVSSATEDDIADLVETYQDEEYTPRLNEVNAIWEWMEAYHNLDPGDDSVTCGYCGEIHTQAEFIILRNAKADRLNEIDGEIDDEWHELVDACMALIRADEPDAIDEYLSDMNP